MKNSVIIFSIFFVLVGCVSTPPDNPDNICKIFQEKRGWYKAAIRTEKRWKLPPYVLMSFVFQESSFKGNASQIEKNYLVLFHGLDPQAQKDIHKL